MSVTRLFIARVAEFGRRTGLRIRRGNPWGFESPLSHQLPSKVRERTGISHEQTAVFNYRDRFAASRFHLLGSKLRIWPLLPNAPSGSADLPTIRKSGRLPGVPIPIGAASAGFPTMGS